MCPWEEDILSGKFNKHLQPSSTVPEWRAKENDLRLLPTNGRIIKDERQLFADRSLYTADSENEEDKRPTKKANIKTESSGREGAESEGSPKSLNRTFTSVKSELRNRTSEYSDVSDSEDSGPDCTALVCSEPQALCVIWWGVEHPCRRRLITGFPKLISGLCST